MNDAMPIVADARSTLRWSTRARLFVADLVAFDPNRIGWALALRTTAGLALPLLLAHALAQPSLVWIGLGAYLIAIGDSTDDGDRAQPIRIVTGAVLGALAVTSGVLAGTHLATAVAGTMIWGIITGMMGIYGNAFAVMSLPIAWAYVELGLPAAEHTVPNALLTGGMFALGGLLTLVLTLMVRFPGALVPATVQTATCFRELVRYLDTVRVEAVRPPEPRVRTAIAEARRLVTQRRKTNGSASRINQRDLMLIEIADRLFSIIGAMREMSQPPIPECKAALLAIAAHLDGRAKLTELRRLRSELKERMTAQARESTSIVGGGSLERRLAEELGHAIGLAANDELPHGLVAPTTRNARLAEVFSPVWVNLDINSVVTRHALRFALVTSMAVVAFWVFPKPFGYWIPLTATVVLKPYAGLTLLRAVQRVIGTVAGISAGLVLMPLLPTVGLQFSATIVFFFAMMAVLPFNYGLAIAFLSTGLIPFEHVLTPDIQAAIGTDRLVATAIGATLALVGGHILWPTFERRGLPGLLRICTEAMAGYTDIVLGAAQGDVPAGDMQDARHRAGLALSNLQMGVQRSLTEVGGGADAMTAILRAATALQRLSSTLNSLLQTAPTFVHALPALGPFRSAFVLALGNPSQGELSIGDLRARIPTADLAPEAARLSPALDQLVSALEMLRDAHSRDADVPRGIPLISAA